VYFDCLFCNNNFFAKEKFYLCRLCVVKSAVVVVVAAVEITAIVVIYLCYNFRLVIPLLLLFVLS